MECQSEVRMLTRDEYQHSGDASVTANVDTFEANIWPNQPVKSVVRIPLLVTVIEPASGELKRWIG
jgi:hypothetical protein